MTKFLNARDVAKRLAAIKPTPKIGCAREREVRDVFNTLWSYKTKPLTDFEILAQIVGLEKTRGGKVWMAGLQDLIKNLKSEVAEAGYRKIFNNLKVGDVIGFTQGPNPTALRTIVAKHADDSFTYETAGRQYILSFARFARRDGRLVLSAEQPEVPADPSESNAGTLFDSLKVGDVFSFANDPIRQEIGLPQTVTGFSTLGKLKCVHYRRGNLLGNSTRASFIDLGGYLVSRASSTPIAGSRDVLESLQPGTICKFTKPGPKLPDHVYIQEETAFEVVSVSYPWFDVRYQNEDLRASASVWVRRGGVVVTAEKVPVALDAHVRSDEELRDFAERTAAFESIDVGDTVHLASKTTDPRNTPGYVVFRVSGKTESSIHIATENGKFRRISLDVWRRRKGEILSRVMETPEARFKEERDPVEQSFLSITAGDTIRFEHGYMGRQPVELFKVESVNDISDVGNGPYRVLRITGLVPNSETIHVALPGWKEYGGQKVPETREARATQFVPTFWGILQHLRAMEENTSGTNHQAREICKELHFAIGNKVRGDIPASVAATLKELVVQLRNNQIEENSSASKRSVLYTMGMEAALELIPGIKDVPNAEVSAGLKYLSTLRAAYEMKPEGF